MGFRSARLLTIDVSNFQRNDAIPQVGTVQRLGLLDF
jgi:hypothetical protein